jgi:8-oxo-dGTP diphosphatase
MSIRNSAKAIVFHNGEVLLNRCVSDNGDIYYDLPGGGQNQYETMEEALVREVLEETGYDVTCSKLLAVAEEISDNPEWRNSYPDYADRIIHVFLAELISETAHDKTEPDHQQDECLWFPPYEADLLNLRPCNLQGHFSKLLCSDNPKYFGCVRMP